MLRGIEAGVLKDPEIAEVVIDAIVGMIEISGEMIEVVVEVSTALDTIRVGLAVKAPHRVGVGIERKREDGAKGLKMKEGEGIEIMIEIGARSATKALRGNANANNTMCINSSSLTNSK